MKILFTNWAPIVQFGLASGFQELGHETEFCQEDERDYYGIKKKIEQFKPDLMITEGGVGREEQIFPLLKEYGIPHVYWAIEDPVSQNLSIGYGKQSVLTLTTCTEWIDQVYKPNGINAISVPFACNPKFHKPVSPNPIFAHESVFVGNNYNQHPYRFQGYNVIFKPLMEEGEVAFYGHWWTDPTYRFQVPPQMFKGNVGNQHLPEICSSSQFILGVHSIDGSSTMQSMRTFEVLGCGGFFFTHYSTALDSMFKNHEHLVWSHTPEETKEIYHFYKENPDRMQKVRDQGRQFVYENHTYKHRVLQILEALPPYLRKKAGM